MDPLTISTSFATIVGLICNFKQERKAGEAASYQEFMDWLGTHRHEQLRDDIAQTFHLQSEVTALLREDSARLAAKLNRIEAMIATLLSQVDGFAEIARKLHPDAVLSPQAVEILEAFVNSGGPQMVTIRNNEGGVDFAFPPASPQFMRPGEPRFFEDDMGDLLALGLVIQGDFSRDGDPRFKLTRAGAAYVAQLASMKGNGDQPALIPESGE